MQVVTKLSLHGTQPERVVRHLAYIGARVMKVEDSLTPDLDLILQFRQHLRECRTCPISTDDNRPVPYSGDSGAEFAIMGEAPGATEARLGQPFVGDTGNILNHWLKQAGFDRSSFAFLNACACYPKRTPTAAEMKACRGWVHGQLEIIRPKVLITLGVVAFKQIRGPANPWPALGMIHGKPMRHPVYGFAVVSSYHPAAYLRGKNRKYEKLITEDLAAIRSWWEGEKAGVIWPSDSCYVCGDEFYRHDDWAIPLCYRHSARAGMLFDEDAMEELTK